MYAGRRGKTGQASDHGVTIMIEDESPTNVSHTRCDSGQAAKRGEMGEFTFGRRGASVSSGSSNAGKLYTLLFLFVFCTLLYYFGELVDFAGWKALRWDFFYTVHDVHRVVFLIPICFAAYCFRVTGAVITTIFAFVVFLPRGLLLSPFPDPTMRMVVFVIFALCLGIFIGILRNQYERLQHQYEQLQHSIDASQK